MRIIASRMGQGKYFEYIMLFRNLNLKTFIIEISAHQKLLKKFK